MRLLIVDDEAPARDRLQQLLSHFDDVDVIGEASDGRQALQMCQDLEPDTVLLDIRMPDMDGIEAARHLGELECSPAVIFTTAYDSYAIEAFDAQAIGYLLKPVRRERLDRALKHASRLSAGQMTALSTNPEKPLTRSNICVRKQSGLRLIPVEEVIYFQAGQKYVTLVTATGEELIDEPLKDLAAEFGDRFIRIHRSVLIALDFLDRMDRNAEGQYQVWLRGRDDPLPVSRRHVTAVKACLKRIA